MDHRRGQGETPAVGGSQQAAAAAAAHENYSPGPVALLPDEVLADILRRLPLRCLAVSRCVCPAWRAAVDAGRLLRADLLPLSPGGIFINFSNYCISELFSCPSAASTSSVPAISGKHNYLPDPESCSWQVVSDHCNGLVLIERTGHDTWYVLNPATRWVDTFPSPPPLPKELGACQDMYLAYDPAMSPDYYKVIAVSRLLNKKLPGVPDYDSSVDEWDLVIEEDYNSSIDERDPETEESEWPPSVCTLHVFSSRTRQWEERSFAREGRAAGTVADMREEGLREKWNAVYWRGSLYVHCQTDFVMRISLSSDKYHVIVKPPLELETSTRFYLGKSAKGVYCAIITGRCRVLVWNLDESGGQMEWVLKHDRDLRKWLLKHDLEHMRPSHRNYGRAAVRGPWTLQNINYCYNDYYNKDDDMEAPVEEKFEWTSQTSVDEKFTWSSDDEYGDYGSYMDILGFHPSKEIIFLGESITRGLAYDLNSSTVEILGNIYPALYDMELGNEQLIMSSFTYTPCWIGQTADENK